MDGINEMTISLRDLIYRLLLRWRAVFVCLILGTVLFGWVGYMKNVNTAKTIEKSNSLTAKELIEKYESELPENELSMVNAVVSAYENSEVVEEYYSNSIRMKLDPQQVPTVRLQYLIDNHYEAVYPVVEGKDNTSDILYSYAVKISDTAAYQDVAKALKEGTAAAYIEELVTVEEAENQKWWSADILTVRINGLDEEDCRKISDTVKEIIETETASLKKIYGDFDITLIHEQYFESADQELLKEQQRQAADYSSLVSGVNTSIKNMTVPQKNYYDALLEEKGLGGDIQEEEVTEEIRASLFNKKYILFGAVAGVFLICCYFACRYLFSPSLRIAEDLEGYFHVPNFGILSVEKPKKRILNFVDQWIRAAFGGKSGQFTEAEHIRMICAGIRIKAKKSDITSIYLTGVCNDEVCEEIKQQLCDKLKADIENVRFGKSVIYDAESLEDMVSAEGIVLVERIDGSRYDELKKELDICRQSHIKVLGSVVLN
ncbi:MAG: hypothetical protein HFI68_07640 [Lachnospiraceae bacterium]|nr:hypothetical protein [Lachnospiraceae bacterium]